MLQRIQTVYLLAATALCFACLCLPIGLFSNADTAELQGTMYNLWVSLEPEHQHVFTPWALFALLVLDTLGLATSIFLYKFRPLQARLAMLCCILLIGWYVVYALIVFNYDAAFRPTPWAAFPAIAAIMGYLAFRGIIRDEALVRSLDRLR